MVPCVSPYRHYYDDLLGAFARATVERKLEGFLVKTPQPFLEIATRKLEPLWRACAERGLPIVLKNGAPAEIRKLVVLVPDLEIVLSHFASYKQQLEFITVECDFLSEQQREQILGGTALRVYQWDA